MIGRASLHLRVGHLVVLNTPVSIYDVKTDYINPRYVGGRSVQILQR